jgi:hypothetical protein
VTNESQRLPEYVQSGSEWRMSASDALALRGAFARAFAGRDGVDDAMRLAVCNVVEHARKERAPIELVISGIKRMYDETVSARHFRYLDDQLAAHASGRVMSTVASQRTPPEVAELRQFFGRALCSADVSRADDGIAEDLYRTVCARVSRARADGAQPERIINAIKETLADLARLPFAVTGPVELLARVVTLCVEQYYARREVAPPATEQYTVSSAVPRGDMSQPPLAVGLALSRDRMRVDAVLSQTAHDASGGAVKAVSNVSSTPSSPT